ncbi:MAG: AraC family transcriptional regulator [Fimbriimonadaceae bacterium]|nr:AraC family transcriptional regulator [Fimbriimonadaceae bacterium]
MPRQLFVRISAARFTLYNAQTAMGASVRKAGAEEMELGFDCGAIGHATQTPEFPDFRELRVSRIQGHASKSVYGELRLPRDHSVLVFNEMGAVIARQTPRGSLLLIPPQSVFYARCAHLYLQAARGEHRAILVTWAASALPVLETYVQTRLVAELERGIVCRPSDPEFKPALRRLAQVRNESLPPAMGEVLMASVLHEVLARLLQGESELQLASVPDDLPEALRDLIRAVRTTPSAPWPLKDAAGLAGYSPFHFSRVFKQSVGYGFHEYVDRCRTENAVRLLISSPQPIDVIAQTSGFGTTQGLRESIKDYLGLVPSELRTLTEAGSENSR